jgi:hypothetical protein
MISGDEYYDRVDPKLAQSFRRAIEAMTGHDSHIVLIAAPSEEGPLGPILGTPVFMSSLDPEDMKLWLKAMVDQMPVGEDSFDRKEAHDFTQREPQDEQ